MTSRSFAAANAVPARSSLPALTLGALGVVFGDIGTSPLYAFKVAFAGAHALAPSAANVYGILSLIFWAVTLIVSLKYVLFVLQFDNNGEGGVLALLAFATRLLRGRPRVQLAAGTIAILAASLFYGDAVITPAISVLSAVEGLSVAAPSFGHWVLPVTLAILIGLFAIQSRGTGRVGRLFGPVTAVWFLAIAVLGAASIAKSPGVISALDPRHAAAFAVAAPGAAFLALGAVFLAITGAEALYADMGHFGPTPIRIGWFGLAFPALMLNYFGQGALVLRDPGAVVNPFYMLAPPDLAFALVVLATAATIIASQATISGAFSVTQQASRLGYLPRLRARHTSESERGQIYIGRVNWTMAVLVVLLVVGFGSSSDLAAAYGIAVSGTMVLTTALVALVVIALPGRTPVLLIGGLVLVGLAELAFLGTNSTKVPAGGWFPLVCAIVIFTLLTTWKRAAAILAADAARRRAPLEGFIESVRSVARVPGTAIYFSADADAVPTTMLHNLKHNKVMHERVLFITIVNEDVPRVANAERTEVRVVEPKRVYQVSLHYGFMEDPDVLRDMKLLGRHGLAFELLETTFFLGKSTIAPAPRPGLFTWRRELFRWMQRNSPTAAEYFRLPPGRVIELGTQLSL
jgi:KUP system potassium uptake protein